MLVFLCLLGLGTARETYAEDFPPITDAEWELTEVPWAPEADAVVIFRSAEMWMRGDDKVNSTLRIRERIKILGHEGAQRLGQIAIRHTRWGRLSDFHGRTMLADGREVEVGKDAIFEQASSHNDKIYLTSVAFPNVEPGVILDWSFDLSWDSNLYLRPWEFQTRAPVLLSEITFHIPKTWAMRPWGVAPPGQPFQQELHPEAGGRRLRLWLENLPAIPDEPFSVPREDLGARFMLVPKARGYVSDSQAVLETWSDACHWLDEVYLSLGQRSPVFRGRVQDIVREARTQAGGEARAVADSLFRYVRDLRTVPAFHVFPRDITLSEVLQKREGNSAEKALVLRALLEEAGLSADLVWVPSRSDGAIDPEVPSFAWFEKVLVRVELPSGERELLDPTDPRLGFGFLNPDNEGVPAVVHHRKKPEVIEIPVTPADRSRRMVHVDLKLDAEGRVTGTAELELTGHQAWRRIPRGEDPEESDESWEEWLQERWEGFHVEGVNVEEDRERRRVQVRWSLRQRDEVLLGDEADLALSRPLGPEVQRFQLEPDQRRTPVLLGFPRADEVEATVTWPEGWKVAGAPHSGRVENLAGVVEAEVSVDREARTLRYHRIWVVSQRQLEPPNEYRALRDLHEVMSRSDAEALVLVAE